MGTLKHTAKYTVFIRKMGYFTAQIGTIERPELKTKELLIMQRNRGFDAFYKTGDGRI